MRNNVIRYILIFSIIVFGTKTYCANEYSNELVKVDVDQTSEDSVRVNIYTDKPYKDKIIVNKRPDNKYVILLPETSNSVTSKPDISSSTILNDVDVKTQQYSSLPGKGYTKITIDGKKPIEVIPQSFTTKKAVSQKKTSSRPYLSAQQVQTTVPQRILNQQKPVTNNDFVPSYERQRQLNQQQNYIPTPQQSQPSTYVRREPVVTQYTPERTQSPIIQTQTPAQEIVQPANNEIQQNNSIQTQEQSQVENINEQDNKQAVDDASQSNDEINDDELEFFKKILKLKQKVIKKIKKLLSVRISFSSVITILQLILLVVIVKIISDLVKKVQSPSEPQSLTKRLIHDNDETFEQAYPSYSNMDVYNANISDFEEDGKEGFNVGSISAPTSFIEKSNAQKKSYSNGIQTYNRQINLQNDFYKPLSEINEEERMSIFDENSKDIERTIFKNPLTQLSKQDEETLFDEIEPEQENTPFSKDTEQDDFFNYTNSAGNEEDFFIFEDEDDDENIEYQEDYIDEDDEDDYEEDEYEYSEDVEEDTEGYTEEDNEDTYEVSSEDVEEKKPQVTDPFEHLTVHAKYVIDSQRGFAQVSVDGVNALIGYVGSKISVIRKFKEEIKGSMQVRLNEQPDPETMIYIIKVGSFKTLVEVKPQSIRQLLDL